MNENHVMVLTPLPWQAPLWDQLVERDAQQRLPHALLLHGTAGIGKGRLARLLALSLLCEKPQQHLPCGNCYACQMFAAGSHPDFFLADNHYGLDKNEDDDEPKKSKAKKTAVPSKQIKIDCIRNLIQFGAQTAHQNGKRVALIEPAEWMNHNAANALLKTLEEPGDGMHIILVSHQPSRLLPTLRSRCQALFCATPDAMQSLTWLQQQHISKERAEAVLAFTHQAPLKALDAANEQHDVLHKEVMEVLEASRNGTINYLAAAETLVKHDATTILDWWLTLVHQKMRRNPRAASVKFYDSLLSARRKVLGTANPNARMVFETLLIEWMQ